MVRKKDPNRDDHKKKNRPFELNFDLNGSQPFTSPPRSGTPCPQCRNGVLDYDGLLNLSCSRCGYTLAGCFS